MTAGYKLDWKGDSVLARISSAAQKGIDETMAECVLAAQITAPRDTGVMATNIRIISRAKKVRTRLAGHWGNDTQSYTLWQEIGSRGRAGRYFLRRAKDVEYPKLVTRIRAWAAQSGRV